MKEIGNSEAPKAMLLCTEHRCLRNQKPERRLFPAGDMIRASGKEHDRLLGDIGHEAVVVYVGEGELGLTPDNIAEVVRLTGVELS